ncbi:MAG: OB-fold nucleic acid binding domain-containing protein, partial [Rhodospirillales bacterium]
MRPEILFSLFKPVTSLKGVGPRIAKLVEKAAGPSLVDLCWHLPNGIIDRRYAPTVAEAEPGVVATMTLTVDRHKKPPTKRLPYKVYCSDDSGTIALVFFHAREDYLRKTLPEGEVRVVSGKVERFGDELQITHPDHVGTADELSNLQAVEPVYPLTTGLTLRVLGKAVRQALEAAPALEEWIDGAYLAKQEWRPWRDALLAAHAPEDEAALEPLSPARRRLAYDELLANQLALALVRAAMRRVKGRAIEGDGRLRAKATAALPVRLTQSQEAALGDIAADMAAPVRMLRLLQGDVGSGKTVVALLAMLNAVETG